MDRRSALITLVSMIGGIAFLVYCAVMFSHWDLYFLRQRMGWNVQPDYIFPITQNLRLLFPRVGSAPLSPANLSRIAGALTLWMLIGFALAEYLRWRQTHDDGLRDRLGLHAAAWILYCLNAAAFANRDMVSMFRYAYPIHVLLLLALARCIADGRKSQSAKIAITGAYVTVSVLMLTMQWTLIARFAGGEFLG